MVKSLLDKLGKRARNTILVATAVASLGFAGCKLPEPEPPKPPVDPTIPTLDLSGVVGTTLIEEQKGYITNLPQIDDKGNAVTYNLATAPQNIMLISRDNNQLEVTSGNITQDENYSIILDFTDNVTGKQGTANLEIKVENLVDISGILESDEEEGILKQGIVKLFDASTNALLGSASNGSFNIQADALASSVKLEAAIKEGGTWKSYVRTIALDGKKDYSNVVIRAVPFPAFDCSYGSLNSNDNFKTFMNQIDFYSEGGITKLIKFDLNQIEGIEILLKNPDSSKNWNTSGNPDIGWQYSNDPSSLKAKILGNGVADYIEGGVTGDNLYVNINGQQKIISVQIENSPNSQNNYDSAGSPNIGWIIAVPDKTIGGGKTNFFWDFDNSRTLTKRARINLGAVNDVVPTHEFGHVFIASNLDTNGHCNIPPFYNASGTNTLTMMVPDNLPSTTGVADIKASHIIYENTYNPGEKIDDILGKSFSDGEFVY